MYGWPVDQVLEKKCEREVSFKQIDNSDIMRHWAELWKYNIHKQHERREANRERESPFTLIACMDGDGEQYFEMLKK